MERIEVITGERRHRRWSLESKLRILSEASAAGIPAAAVARRHDLHPQQLYRWRRELGVPAGHREEIRLSCRCGSRAVSRAISVTG